MQLDGNWLQTKAVQAVFHLLEEGGHQAYAVGGSVRNALWGEPVSDIDVSTDARPDRVAELARKAQIKFVPTGVEHGTLTLVVDGVAIEVTTFRRDVETDGRRAVVAFADHIEEDAHRRDFTVNAIYADRTGRILDPLNGLEDIAARRIRFIDDPELRIREDALRILRFFRFQAWYADPALGIEPEGLAACAQNGELLDQLSAERVTVEIKKLLSAFDPAPAIATMDHAGLLQRVLPGATAGLLAPLIDLETGRPASWPRRLAVLGGLNVSGRLRLSKKETASLEAISAAAENGIDPKRNGYLFGADAAIDAALVCAASTGTSPPQELQELARAGAAQEFPVKPNMLIPPLSAGPELGRVLKSLEEAWIASDFTASREDLLAGVAISD